MKSFPFDSAVTYDSLGNPEYDRAADSALLADFLHLMFTDGVFPNPSTGLQVVASENEMSVVVCPGNTMIQGRMGIEEVARTLVFEASGTSYDRIDAVVARLNTNYAYRDIDLYVVKGTASATPAAPELTRTGGIYELRLANVFIAKNTTMISAERITDTRLNTEDCGIVTSNPQRVDTTAIFNQYQAALEQYLQFVRDCIDGTTAGSILTRLDGVDTRLGTTDISEIGDGSVTGAIAAQGTAISALNTDIAGKAPAAHTHTWGGITGKPATFMPSAHTQAWDTITGKPATYAPSTHTHDDRYYLKAEVNNMESLLSQRCGTAVRWIGLFEQEITLAGGTTFFQSIPSQYCVGGYFYNINCTGNSLNFAANMEGCNMAVRNTSSSTLTTRVQVYVMSIGV